MSATIRSQLTRRSFLGSSGAGMASLLAPRLARTSVRPRVVVVGGGFAGATVAKYLRLWGDDSVEVVLVDRRATHVSCVMSNLVLNERLRLGDLRFTYDALRSRYGVQVVRGRVEEIDAPAGRIAREDGSTLAYDRLVLAPGVAFRKIPGWDASEVPHAWIAGQQTNLLRDQLRDMPDDGTFVMTVPRAPYRCPPGPYERACLVADLLGRRSGALGGAGTGRTPRVVVLDANGGIQAERETFTRAFETLYRDIVEYRPNVEIVEVDSASRAAITDTGEWIQGDVLNIIPEHRAPWLLRGTGLTDAGPWAPVDPLSYESVLERFEGVHVIGDSQATGQPKSGHMANAQAKVCADAVLRLLAGLPVDTEERAANITTNSACFSPITYDEASWLTAVFRYDPVTARMVVSGRSLGEGEEWNRGNFREMFNWSENLFADTFG